MKSKAKNPTFSLRRSIFQKYLALSLSIIMVSMITLGVIMFFFVSDYWEKEKKSNLIENANLVASTIVSLSNYNTANHTIVIEDPEIFSNTMLTISDSIDADIFVVNNKGKLIYCAQRKDCIHKGRIVSSELLGRTVNTNFFEYGTLDGFYDEQYYTAGVPIILREAGLDDTVAFCYVSSKSDFVAGLTVSMLQMFLTTGISIFLISIALVGIFNYSMSKPLRQMSRAAKKFAIGDFSTRVSQISNDEVGELAVAFNQMADSLTASEGMRRSFIANVSHELKTPMTTIAGFIDGMLDGTIPESQHRHYMNIVSLEVKRLSRLVQSMLSLSRIDNGELKLNKQEFEMFSVIVNVLAGFELKISEKNIEIRGLEDLQMLKLNADPDLMHQVIYNLIENAVKFTNEGGYIAFSAIKTKYDLTVSIENSGPGIPPEDIRFVFDRFYKTDKSRSIDKKGMGLGLFITKSIVRLHGGHIFVESEPDKFCRFTFKLPMFQKESEKNQNNKFIDTTAKLKMED